jgi:hypothetical protein
LFRSVTYFLEQSLTRHNGSSDCIAVQVMDLARGYNVSASFVYNLYIKALDCDDPLKTLEFHLTSFANCIWA